MYPRKLRNKYSKIFNKKYHNKNLPFFKLAIKLSKKN